MLFIYAIPVLSLALVAWAAASRGLSSGLRRASMVAAIVLACGTLTLIRTNGVTGDADSDFEWRWTPDAGATASCPGRRRASRLCCGSRSRSQPRSRHAACDSDSLGRAPSPRLPRRLRSSRRRRTSAVPETAASRRRSLPMRRDRTREPSGPASADPSATASFAACGSKPTGLARRRSSCGAGRSDRAGHPSPSPAIACSRRSSAVTTRSCRPTT